MTCRTVAVCLGLLLAMLAAGQAAAQTRRDLALACREDYQRFCRGVQPGGGAVLACLRQHAASLSERCRTTAEKLRDQLDGDAKAKTKADTKADAKADAGSDTDDGPDDDGPDDSDKAPPSDKIAVAREIAYGPSAAQRMDVYRTGTPKGAPVLFIVHGGAWVAGDKASHGVVAAKVAHWVPRGYLVVSANYRLLPEAHPLTQADDVAKALATAQAQARSWGGDPARFVLMGHSAGAHLVALLAADPAIAARQGAKGWLGTIALDSAALDVPQIMDRPHPPLYDRAFGEDPTLWRMASPVHRLTGAPTPMLLVCSTSLPAPCAQAEAFAAKAASKGGKARVLPVPLTHAAINRDLGLPGPYTAAVEAFLRSLGLP